jgi:hypothetical protein
MYDYKNQTPIEMSPHVEMYVDEHTSSHQDTPSKPDTYQDVSSSLSPMDLFTNSKQNTEFSSMNNVFSQSEYNTGSNTGSCGAGLNNSNMGSSGQFQPQAMIVNMIFAMLNIIKSLVTEYVADNNHVPNDNKQDTEKPEDNSTEEALQAMTDLREILAHHDADPVVQGHLTTIQEALENNDKNQTMNAKKALETLREDNLDHHKDDPVVQGLLDTIQDGLESNNATNDNNNQPTNNK